MRPGQAPQAVALLALAAIVASPAPAIAAPIDLAIAACPSLDRDEVVRIATVELASLAARLPPEFVVPVQLSCRASGAVVRVEDPITQKTLERTVALDRVGASARPRLVALAVVGLLVASWAELDVRSAAPTDEAPPAVRDPGRDAAVAVAVRQRRDVPTVQLFVAASATWMGRKLGVAPGLGVRSAIDGSHGLGFSADIRLDHARTATGLGDVEFTAVSAAPGVHVHRQRGPLVFRAALAARLGLGRLAGEPADPGRVVGGTLTAVWFGPAARLSLGLRLPFHAALEAAIESGSVVLPMTGLVAGSREVVVGGPWAGASLALGWVLD